MGEAIITRRGGSGEVIVEFENFTPSNTVAMYHPDGELTRSTPTGLSAGRIYLAGASVGNYALFAGGSSYGDRVDAYNTDLVRSTPTALSEAREQLAGASVGNYALFAGGFDFPSDDDRYKDTVDAYDTDLVRFTPTALSVGRERLVGASVGNYALFAGGKSGSWEYKDTVDAYDTSLVRFTPTALSVERYDLAGTSVGNYALFAGGYGSPRDKDTVDAYDTSLVRFTPTALSVSGDDYVGASVGNYALFAGGYDGNRGIVNAYDTSLVHSTPTALSVARFGLAGASVGSYALFAGGYGYEISGSVNTVDAYDTSLVRSTPTALSVARYQLAGASVGDYALFAGGTSNGSQNAVDAYTLQVSVAVLCVPIGTKYKFGESEETATTNEITARVPLTGYIKYKSEESSQHSQGGLNMGGTYFKERVEDYLNTTLEEQEVVDAINDCLFAIGDRALDYSEITILVDDSNVGKWIKPEKSVTAIIRAFDDNGRETNKWSTRATEFKFDEEGTYKVEVRLMPELISSISDEVDIHPLFNHAILCYLKGYFKLRDDDSSIDGQRLMQEWQTWLEWAYQTLRKARTNE